jgi:chorismate-pyruvate lyase
LRHEVRADAGQDFGIEMHRTLQALEAQAGVSLSRYEKILLAEIATMEQVLSIIADSNITVVPLSQETDGGVLIRRAALNDERGVTLLQAESHIHLSLLPDAIRDDLLSGRGGIGTILRRYNVETLRRIDHLGYDDERRMLYRRYFIIVNGETWFDIREEFEAGKYV